MSRLASLSIIALASSAWGLSTGRRADPAVKACQLLQSSFPQLVSFPGSEQYESDIEHWGISSSQNATCSIEPQTADDICSILKIIGRSDIMAPFAVKSGGHAHNRGHSSTTGVQISMARFNGLTYDSNSGTVTIGVGLTWDQVYSQLEPLGVMVVGGRVPGVGVGGLSLGGGYSWKTDQYGLTIDTLISHNIVLPSGQQVRTSSSSYSDLFFGLKGGLNNFGIVTNITLKVHPQTQVYGGVIVYGTDQTDAMNAAISEFSAQNADPKAQIANIYTSAAGQFSNTVILFYDAPSLPSGTYDAFFSIPSLYTDLKTRTYTDFVITTGSYNIGFEPFGEVNHVIPITKYTEAVLSKMVEETITAEAKLTAASNGSIVGINMIPEPFINPFSNAQGGAYPHTASHPVTPSSPTFVYQINPNWTADDQSAFHELVVSTMKEFCNNVQTVAVAEGVSSWDDILYSNYALGDTPLKLLFGSNLSSLKKIAKKYDPKGLMKLTGGFHF